MVSDQQSVYEDLSNKEAEVAKSWITYWQQFSNFSTWQFWFNLAFLLIPLIVLWFCMDRKKAFQIGFYGFNIHVLATYIDIYGERNHYWGFPFKIIPYLPTSVSLDASMAPVSFMLLYQWTINHKKNYYLASLALSAIFAFVIKPILSSINLFHLYNGMNYFYLFLLYYFASVIAKLVTDLFNHFQTESKKKITK
ncbi:CBO0543 family protein [Paenibacillus sp. GCM10027628]|uniref:CBO0543 family protein n=1 Tax=Paenibacillus sp. GCM10027628 TaxID=3273413 RepID=UPI0036298F28